MVDDLTPMQALDDWHERGWLRAVDKHLALVLSNHGVSTHVAWLVALVSHQVGRGHTCVSLSQLWKSADQTLELPPSHYRPSAEDPLTPAAVSPTEIMQQRTLAQWREHILASSATRLTSDADELQPLVFDEAAGLLYLRRYWDYERGIEQWLESRLNVAQLDATQTAFLHATIERLMPSSSGSVNWQRIACANAAKQGFSIITGGPGTGKTYTVLRVLATLLGLHQQQHGGRPLRIAMAAPTGKAAARMQESLRNSLDSLAPDYRALVAPIVERKASTLHRLLGVQAGTRYFRHQRDLTLPFDVVVVDEASMIDTELFGALLDALAPTTRLILLGDKDQLTPVEAGSVLASLCRGAEQGGYSPEHWQWIQEASGEALGDEYQSTNMPGLLNHVVMLRHSHRFSGAIADLATAVNRCDVTTAEQVLVEASPETLRVERGELEPATLVRHLAAGFQPFLEVLQAPRGDDADAWALEVLAAYGKFQVLCALRAGPWGQREINRLMTLALGGKPDKWYGGRPVMVTQNDYSLNLNNGDIGVVLRHPEDGLQKVVFAGKEPNTVRWVLPSRLSDVETVYAMTVHKSQGSEFAHAVLVLPDRYAPVLTKELVYTGITRAKKCLTLVLPDKRVWQQSVTHQIERLGGL